METPYDPGRPAQSPRSLWEAVTPGIPGGEKLRGEHRSDVIVVGAGFMGLSAALHLAESAVDVTVLEAATVGWGASGRNNGLLVPGLKRDPHEARKFLGNEPGERLLRLSGDAPARVFDMVERLGIHCDANRRGWLQAAHARAALPAIEKRARDWQELGADVALVPNDAVAARLGTDYYAGAWFDPRGGSLNPLAYVRGLAVAAGAAGARIFEHSPATTVEKCPGGWRVRTPAGIVVADAVLYCTNAYNHGNPVLRASVIPLRTAQVASFPLSDAQARTILPGGESASDTQRLLTSFRLTADKRLIMGGASATAGEEHEGLFRHLHLAADRRFPRLGKLSWEFGWSGYLALTRDHLPAIFRLAEGYYAGIGCNGRGIAMATAVGKELAEITGGKAERECDVPVRRLNRIPGYALRHPGVAAGVFFNRALDSLERRLGR
jgi:glycine/D-amino acid oxidase-like deaminating enzyme